MARIKEFNGILPKKDIASTVVALPYDVITVEEARKIADQDRNSFYRINKPEVNVPEGTNPYSLSVYDSARKNFNNFIERGILIQDKEPFLYLYTLTQNGRSQTGLVSVVHVKDYIGRVIKRHEQTKQEKVQDRAIHMDFVSAHIGPVFTFFKDDGRAQELFESNSSGEPDLDFETDDGVRHTLRRVSGEEPIGRIKSLIAKKELYIADGHHRAAAAVAVAEERKKRGQNPSDNEECNWFLIVAFPHHQLKVEAYNRVVRGLFGYNEQQFMTELQYEFKVDVATSGIPEKEHQICMYIGKMWYVLTPKFPIPDDPKQSLDVDILQKYIFQPILGIDDPTTDDRLEFVGGVKGTKALEEMVDSGDYSVAFSMYPVTTEQIMNITKMGNTMPPKSTWFEPKLLSGLVCHSFQAGEDKLGELLTKQY